MPLLLLLLVLAVGVPVSVAVAVDDAVVVAVDVGVDVAASVAVAAAAAAAVVVLPKERLTLGILVFVSGYTNTAGVWVPIRNPNWLVLCLGIRIVRVCGFPSGYKLVGICVWICE